MQRDRTAIVNQIQLIITKEPVSVNARAAGGPVTSAVCWVATRPRVSPQKANTLKYLCNVTWVSWPGPQCRDNKSEFKSRTRNCLLCIQSELLFSCPARPGETWSVGPGRVAPQHLTSAQPRVRIAPAPVVARAHSSGPHLPGHVPG
jgi:hypothetical protein